MVRRFAVYVLLLAPISLSASWVMQAPDVEAFTSGSIAIPVFGTTQDSIRGFEFQMAFCDDEDSLKITVDSVTLRGYGAPYITIFDTLPTADSWTLDVDINQRSMYWGIAFIGQPDTPSVPVFDSAIIYVMWVHVESSVNAPDTVKLDLNENPTCPPGNSYECGFIDPQYNLRRAQLVDGTLSILPYTLELSFEPGQPQNFPEGEVNQINVQGTSSDSNDVFLLQLIDGLEPWMVWSGDDMGPEVEGYVGLYPGHCDDGLYELRFRLRSYIHDTSIIRIDTVIIYDMDRPPFFVSVAPGDGIYGAGSLIEENVVFSDSDMACPMGHVVDFLTLSYYLIPEPVATEPNLIDNGDGSGTFEWTPAVEDEGNYTLGLVATDMYGVSDTVEVTLQVRAQPGYLNYSYRLQLKQMCAFSGDQVYYPVYLTNPEPVAGYEILIAYDSTRLSLQDIVENEIGGHTSEYFNYNLIQSGVVDSFPAVRVVAIRDLANAVYTPPFPADTGQVLFYLVFDVAYDIPPNSAADVKFVVNELSDNTLSDTTGLILHTPVIIDVATQGSEPGDCSFEEYFVAMGDSTQIAWDIALVDGFDWVEGWENCDPVSYCPAGVITVNPALVGDVNLNTYPYEVADAVMLAKVFVGIYHIDDDTTTPPVGWTMAEWNKSKVNSDINLNGFYYEMGDLILLVAIINGFVNPPQTGDGEGTVDVAIRGDAIYLRNDTEISALYLELEPEIPIGNIEFGRVTEKMTADWNEVDGKLRILIWGVGDCYIPPGEWKLMEVRGCPDLKITKVEAGSPWGTLLKANWNSAPPFSIERVYPNPFKRMVTVDFTLRQKSPVELKVYDVSGKLVKRISAGQLEPGKHTIAWDGKNSQMRSVSSGVYFLELESLVGRSAKKILLLR